MISNDAFDRVVVDLTKHLKSLVRERQRIWQIMHQEQGDIVITLSRGNLKTVFRGSIKVGDALRTYLMNIDEEINLLTGWIVNPETIPPAALVSHYLHTKYFR